MSAVEDLNQERRITFCLYEYWEKLAGESGLPALKNMNREEIAPFKKNLVLIDLRNGRDQPTFQVIGQDLQEDLESDLTSMPVSSVPRRTMLSRVTDHYLEVLANRVPIAFEAEFVNRDGEKALYRGILLPFSDDNQNINFILGGVRWILESDVSLDDSKPTIEELMKTISAGREGQPIQLEKEAVADEHTDVEMGEDTSDEDVTVTENNLSIDETSPGDIHLSEKVVEDALDHEEADTVDFPIEDELEGAALEAEIEEVDASIEDDILDLTDEAEEVGLVDDLYTAEDVLDVSSDNMSEEDTSLIEHDDTVEDSNTQLSTEPETHSLEETFVDEELELNEQPIGETDTSEENEINFDEPITESEEFETVEETSVNKAETPVVIDQPQIDERTGLVHKKFLPVEDAVEVNEENTEIADAIDLEAVSLDSEDTVTADHDQDDVLKMEGEPKFDVEPLIDSDATDEMITDTTDFIEVAETDIDTDSDGYLSLSDDSIEQIDDVSSDEITPEVSFKDIIDEQLTQSDEPLAEEHETADQTEDHHVEQDELSISEEAETDASEDVERPATIEELLRSADDDIEMVEDDASIDEFIAEENEDPVSSTSTLLEALEDETAEEPSDGDKTEIAEEETTIAIKEIPEVLDTVDEAPEPVETETPISEAVTEIQEEVFEIDDTPDDDLSIEELMQSIIAERKFDSADESDRKHSEKEPQQEEPSTEALLEETVLDNSAVVEEDHTQENVIIETDDTIGEGFEPNEHSQNDTSEAPFTTEQMPFSDNSEDDISFTEEADDALHLSEDLVVEEVSGDSAEEEEAAENTEGNESGNDEYITSIGVKFDDEVTVNPSQELVDDVEEDIDLVDEANFELSANLDPDQHNIPVNEEPNVEEDHLDSAVEATENDDITLSADEEINLADEEINLADEDTFNIEEVDVEEYNFNDDKTEDAPDNAESNDSSLSPEEETDFVDETNFEFSAKTDTVQDIIELVDEPQSETQSIELDSVAEVSTPEVSEAPVKKRRRGSMIERAMEKMAPNFGIKPPVEEKELVVGTTENIETPEQSDVSEKADNQAITEEEQRIEPFIDELVTADKTQEDAAPEDDLSIDIIEALIEDDVVHPADELVDEILSEENTETEELQNVHENELDDDENIEIDVLEDDAIECEDNVGDDEHTQETISDEEGTNEPHTLQDLRTTLKQIVGYIKKEDANHNRSRDSLYNILTAIYEFHNTCEKSPTAYNKLVNENDLKVQSRAPYTPVLKICLGKDYDKTRLTEYAAALGIARYMNVEVSEFHAFIKNFPGGIKGCVKEMRIIRKHGASGNITARKTRSIEEAREILRNMAPIASFRLKKVIVGNNVDEFCLLLAKRDGHDISVLKILDDKYTKLEPILKRSAFIKGNLNDRK